MEKVRKPTTLDLLPPGPVAPARTKADEKRLPDGVRGSALYRDVVNLAFPSMAEMFLTQLSSMVDMMMVGQLGSWALSSVGLATQPKFLIMTLFMAMNVGATAMVARYRGAQNPEKANMILRQALLLTFILGAVGSVFGTVFSRELIAFMGAPDAASLRGGTIYFRVQSLGLLTLALASTATAALRGVGNSRTPMFYNITANIVNVIFNYLLIYGNFGFPRLEVLGASIATVIGQSVALVLAVISLVSGRNYIKLRFRDSFRPDKESLLAITKVGLPALLEQAIMRVGIITYTRIVTSLGTILYATHLACMNTQAMSFMLGQGLAVASTSLVGQSLGKGRPDMARHYSSRTRRIGLVVSLCLAAVFVFLGREIVALYIGDEPDAATIIRIGGQIMVMVAVMLPFQSSQFILAGSLRGAGDTKSTAAISFITVLLVRPGLAALTIFVLGWGIYGAWIALIIDQILRSFLVLNRYNSGKWVNAISNRS